MKSSGVSEVRVKKPADNKPARGKGGLSRVQQRRRAIDLAGGQNTRSVGTKISEALAQAVEAAAAGKKMSVSEYLRMVITDEIHGRKEPPAMTKIEAAAAAQAQPGIAQEALAEVKQLRAEVRTGLFKIHKETEQLIVLSQKINRVLSAGSN